MTNPQNKKPGCYEPGFQKWMIFVAEYYFGSLAVMVILVTVDP
jgi:hypothetical protein